MKLFQLEGAGGPALLSALWSLSGAFTAFEAERIEASIDLGSGETVHDLPALLLERYDLSRAGRLEALEQELASQLRWLQAPTPEQFTAAVEQLALAGDQDELRSLYPLCEQLAEAKPGRDGEEQPALDQLLAHGFLPGRGG